MGIVFFTLVVIVIIFPFNIVRQYSYIPNVITGLATVSSLVSGFAGYLLTHAYRSHENINFKKWFKPRLQYVFLVSGLGFLSISFSFISLVSFDNLELAFRAVFIGWFFMLYFLLESYLVAVSDEADYLVKENF